VRLDATSADHHVPYCLYAQLRRLDPGTETLRVDWPYGALPAPLRTAELGPPPRWLCDCHAQTVVEGLARRITTLDALRTLHVDLTRRVMPSAPMAQLVAALRSAAGLTDVTVAVCTCDVQGSGWLYNLWRLCGRWNAVRLHLEDQSVGAASQAFKQLADDDTGGERPVAVGGSEGPCRLRRLTLHLETKRQMNRTFAPILVAMDRFAGTLRHLSLSLRDTQSGLSDPAGAFGRPGAPLRTLELDVSDTGLSATGLAALLERFTTLVRLRVRAERNDYTTRFWTVLCASLTATRFPALRCADLHLSGNRCGPPPPGAPACLVVHGVSTAQRTFAPDDGPDDDDDAVWM
jgi:hypothetical protein